MFQPLEADGNDIGQRFGKHGFGGADRQRPGDGRLAVGIEGADHFAAAVADRGTDDGQHAGLAEVAAELAWPSLQTVRRSARIRSSSRRLAENVRPAVAGMAMVLGLDRHWPSSRSSTWAVSSSDEFDDRTGGPLQKIGRCRGALQHFDDRRQPGADGRGALGGEIELREHIRGTIGAGRCRAWGRCAATCADRRADFWSSQTADGVAFAGTKRDRGLPW